MDENILTNTDIPNDPYKHDPSEIPLGKDGTLKATAFFTKLKQSAKSFADDELLEYINVSQQLYEKYILTGQVQAAAEVQEYLRVARLELELLKCGFETYVLRSDVAKWAKQQDKSVSKKILFADIEQYTRDIPNDVVQKMLRAKPFVDKFVILFTDYTGQHQKQVDQANEKIKKELDPIIFGAWVPKTKEAQKTLVAHPHLVFIGDWEDQYCDLTLDKLIAEFAKSGNTQFKKTFTPEVIMESALQENLPKKTFLTRVKELLHLC